MFADASGNGNDARPRAAEKGTWLVFAPDPTLLRQGDNDVVIEAGGAGGGALNSEARSQEGEQGIRRAEENRGATS